MGSLEQDARAVARVRVAAAGPAVGKVLDCRDGFGDDVVRFPAADVDNCHDATGSSCNRRFVATFNESMMLIQFCCLPLEPNLEASSGFSLQKLVELTASVAKAWVVSRFSEGGCARMQTISHRLDHSWSYRDLKIYLHFSAHFLVDSAASGSAICKVRSI